MSRMEKAKGAFLTIGELAGELGLAQHILRYWETRFPQLRPLQRSGNRRYYRPADADLVRRINYLLNVQGFTVKGARKALNEKSDDAVPVADQPAPVRPEAPAEAQPVVADHSILIARLEMLRGRLAAALDPV